MVLTLQIPYMVQFLEDMKGVGAPPLTSQEKAELETLRIQQKELLQKGTKKVEKAKADSDESSDSECDEVADLPDMAKMAGAPKARTSVSAEAFGKYHVKEAFTPKVVKKSDEEKRVIAERLSHAFMFQALDQQELDIVIDAMAEVTCKAGDVVIKEGDAGAVLFVVESGQLDCSKVIDGESKLLKTYEPGEAFGELALLYNAPRAATITAKTDAKLYELDRGTFNHIVKDASQRKRDKYEDFLHSVPILQTMDAYERSKMADAIKEKTFAKDEKVITEGEEGQVFYLIIAGEAVATKDLTPGQPATEVMQYKAGEYFGELALLKGEPRAATVTAKSELRCATIDRDSFKRLLGPLD